jgi:hypothetical protein
MAMVDHPHPRGTRREVRALLQDLLLITAVGAMIAAVTTAGVVAVIWS